MDKLYDNYKFIDLIIINNFVFIFLKFIFYFYDPLFKKNKIF